MIKEDVLFDIYTGRARKSPAQSVSCYSHSSVGNFKWKAKFFFSFKRVQLIDLNRKKMSFQENLSI